MLQKLDQDQAMVKSVADQHRSLRQSDVVPLFVASVLAQSEHVVPAFQEGLDKVYR